MKMKTLPTAVLSSQFLMGLSSSFALEYKVEKGDTLTDIAQRQSSEESSHLSYSQMLALILKLNNKENLSEYDFIKIGQVIHLPGEAEELAYLKYYQNKYPSYWNPYAWKVRAKKKYRVKSGDSLSKIAKRIVPGLPLFGQGGSIELFLEKNKSIKDISKIFVGQELIIPSMEEILVYKEKTKEYRSSAQAKERNTHLNDLADVEGSKNKIERARRPAQVNSIRIQKKKIKKNRLPAQIKKRKYKTLQLNDTVDIEGLDDILFDGSSFIKINFKAPLIKSECSKKFQIECYKKFNDQLLKSKERVVALSCLKNLLDYSRECGHRNLENYYLKLISLFLKPQRERVFLKNLKAYIFANC